MQVMDAIIRLKQHYTICSSVKSEATSQDQQKSRRFMRRLTLQETNLRSRDTLTDVNTDQWTDETKINFHQNDGRWKESTATTSRGRFANGLTGIYWWATFIWNKSSYPGSCVTSFSLQSSSGTSSSWVVHSWLQFRTLSEHAQLD